MASSRYIGRSNRVVKYKALREFWGPDGKYYKTGEVFLPRWPAGTVESSVEWGIMAEEIVEEVVVEEPKTNAGFSDSLQEVDDGKNSST